MVLPGTLPTTRRGDCVPAGRIDGVALAGRILVTVVIGKLGDTTICRKPECDMTMR